MRALPLGGDGRQSVRIADHEDFVNDLEELQDMVVPAATEEYHRHGDHPTDNGRNAEGVEGRGRAIQAPMPAISFTSPAPMPPMA